MKEPGKHFITLIFLGLAFIALSQENLRFKKLTKADGLSNNSIFAITQDDEGFIWFGTRDGLNRYDGYRFKIFQYQDNDSSTLVSNDIKNLYFDSKNSSLWVGTLNGLSQYLIEENRFINYFEKENLLITKVLRDSRGRLLVATPKGLFQISENNKVIPIRVRGEQLTPIHDLYEDKHQQLWIATDRGLIISTNNNWDEIINANEKYAELDILVNKDIKRICEDRNNNLWFGCENSGLLKWDMPARVVSIYLNDSESVNTNRIRDIVTDLNGNIWVGTSNGIYIANDTDNELRHIYNDGSYHEGLSNNSIKSMHVDQKGGIWIGTYFRGVNYYDKSFDRFKIALPYKEGADDDQNIISEITEDEQGNIWVGTEGRGLGIWDNGRNAFSFIESDKNLNETNIKSIFPLGDDIWVGTFKKGLIKYATKTKTSKTYIHDGNQPNSIPSNNIYDIEEINGSMWMASFGGGLVKREPNDQFVSFKHKPNDPLTISSNDCRVLHLDQEKDFWVGTNNGLNKVTLGNNGEVHFDRLLPKVTVYSIFSFRPDEIWIGTFYKGLYKYNKVTKELINFTIKDGLPGNTIYSMLVDGASLWISTNNGMAKLDADTHEVIGYKQAGELRNLEFSQNAALAYRNSLFLFGSSNGLVYFKPSEITQSTYQPNLVITDISTLNDNSNPNVNLSFGLSADKKQQTGIELDNHESTLEIKLSSLDFSNPNNIQYAFRMKGLEDTWKYSTGRTEAIYTIQREGDYVFEAKATNSDGIWISKILSLDISVAPPWFRSWWAYLIYLSVFLGLGYFFFRMMRLQNSYQLEHLTNLEQERTHEMKMRFFTNITHEFRTPLTLMLGPLQDMIRSDNTGGALRTKLQGIFRNVHRLSNLVDQLLVFRKIETDHMKMRVSESNLDDFLKEIYLAFRDESSKRNIDYQFISANRAVKLWYDPDKLERVFFNLISNALKFTSDMGAISITMTEEPDYIEVKVNDDGPGVDDSLKELIFERFYERSSTNYSNYGIGIGLSLSKQMVELHAGTIHIEDNETGGSSFIVRLPKGTAHFDQGDLVVIENLNGSLSNSTPNEPKVKAANGLRKENKLLIVEDDIEVSEYLRSLFEEEYALLIENNGKSGYDTAKRELPDVILSDVMMPVMDGITMCSKLKTTLETSHIPVVLLTARSATAYKIGGLETGADDYLTKPFNSEELILKMRNLVKTRQTFLKKIVRIHNFEPDKIAVTSTDEKFLTKLVELTESNIENSNLTIEQFADELHVSRALLFTKIKALTGQTPKGFVKNYRLKRAVQLLEDSDLKVSQIARKCGFRDYRYFTKVFKSQYAMTPKEYRADKSITIDDAY